MPRQLQIHEYVLEYQVGPDSVPHHHPAHLTLEDKLQEDELQEDELQEDELQESELLPLAGCSQPLAQWGTVVKAAFQCM